MRFCQRGFLSLVLVLLAAALSGCSGEQPPSGLFSFTAVLGGQHTFAAGGLVPGDIYVLAGNLDIERGATVGGSLLVVGGDVTVGGTVNGDISLLGGRLALDASARVTGTVTVAGGELNRAPGAIVSGGIEQGEPLSANAPRASAPLADTLLNTFLPALLVAVLAYLLARYLPGPLGRVTDVIVHHPLVALAMGLLAGCIGLVLIVLIAFTIVLIPFSFAGGALLLVAITYGWAAFGMATGRLLARLAAGRLTLTAPAAAFPGSLLFMFVLGLLRFIPLLAGAIPLLLAAIGLGAVLLTRFGLHTFVPATDEAPALLPEEDAV